MCETLGASSQFIVMGTVYHIGGFINDQMHMSNQAEEDNDFVIFVASSDNWRIVGQAYNVLTKARYI